MGFINFNNRLDLVTKLKDKEILKQIRRYLTTGFLSAGSEYMILFLLTRYIGLWYIISNTIALTVGFWISFLLNKYWSFNSRKGMIRQLILYGILFVINLGASNGIVYLLTEKAGFHFMFSKLFAMGMIVMWNFVIYRKVIYK